MAIKIQLRRGTATEWTTANPTLMQGEMGVETDTLKVKIGNGTTAWTSLPYFTQGAKGDTGLTGATGAKGDKGDKGDVGETGPANVLSIGTVTVTAAGTDATATITGTAPNQTLSLTIPKGDKGDVGDAATIAVGTVTTLPAGSPATVTNIGTSGAAVFDFGIPQGTDDLRTYVKNGTGSTVAKGSVVYISGADGTNALISKSKADAESTSSKTLGLVEADIANGGHGYVISDGIIEGLDTSAATAGDSMWLSPSTAGGIVYGSARPTAPNHMVFLGYVLRAHAVNGRVHVKVQNGYELEELHNVQITSPADKQVLAYEGGLWKNKVASGGVTVSEPAPSSPIDGDGWFYSSDGTLFVRYNDGSSTQWVQPNAPLAAQVEQRYYSPNYVMNGAFDINQRGISSSGVGTNQYGLDRWRSESGTGTVTQSVQQFAGSSPATGIEAKQYARIVTSGQSGTSAFSAFLHKIEDVRTLTNKPYTLSFYARVGSGTATISADLGQAFDNGGTGDTRMKIATWTVNTSWQRFTATFTPQSIAGKTIGANSLVNLIMWQSSGSAIASLSGFDAIQNNTFDYWGVQVEEGTTATTFRRMSPSIQAERAACMRYFEIAVCSWRGDANGYAGTTMPFKVTKRVNPSITLLSNNAVCGSFGAFQGYGDSNAEAAGPQWTWGTGNGYFYGASFKVEAEL